VAGRKTEKQKQQERDAVSRRASHTRQLRFTDALTWSEPRFSSCSLPSSPRVRSPRASLLDRGAAVPHGAQAAGDERRRPRQTKRTGEDTRRPHHRCHLRKTRKKNGGPAAAALRKFPDAYPKKRKGGERVIYAKRGLARFHRFVFLRTTAAACRRGKKKGKTEGARSSTRYVVEAGSPRATGTPKKEKKEKREEGRKRALVITVKSVDGSKGKKARDRSRRTAGTRCQGREKKKEGRGPATFDSPVYFSCSCSPKKKKRRENATGDALAAVPALARPPAAAS